MTLFLTLFFLYLGSLFASLYASGDLPQKVTLRRLWCGGVIDFYLDDELAQIGCVRRHFFKSFREYLFFDKGEELIARAKLSLHRAYALFTVTDTNEEVIGFIEEGPQSIHLLDADHEVIAISQIDRWNIEILLVDGQGHTLGSLTRPFFRENNDWSLKVTQEVEWKVHQLLWSLLPVIHSDAPYWSTFHHYHDKNGMR